MILLLLLWMNSLMVEGSDLTDITNKVLGNHSGIIPASFGDFNGDKLTDMIVLKSNQGEETIITIKVLLAKEQRMGISTSNSDPLFHWGTREENLQCNLAQGSITGSTPGDFDGDGGMDLLITYRMNGQLSGTILWGYHTDTTHKLLCKEDQDPLWVKSIPLQQEPLVFDYNYDYISDLLIVSNDGVRRVLVFSEDRAKNYTVYEIDSPLNDELKSQHSNAHIDINSDGLPDLLLTTQTGLEMYERVGNSGKDNFKYHGHVPWPDQITSSACSVDKCVGQAVMTDFDLTGSLDLLIPMCNDTLCKESSMYLIPFAELWNASSWSWTPMSMDLGDLHFLPPSPENNLMQLLAPRVGDINLDGFPDLLMPMQNKDSKPETHLLLNVPCGPLSGCKPFWRRYQIQKQFSQGTGNSVASAFFDLYEDGRPDILTVSGDNAAGFKMSAFTNTSQDSDAYFIKVVVLSGACLHNCRNKSSSYVPYGTNSGGLTVAYRSQRAGPETFDSFQSVAAQMPQSAYFSLQTPYIIFGLGLAPNFIDYLWVNISSMTHSWPQIIPNSQLYIIPYPPTHPEQWEAKISIFPGKSIVITGLAMIGTCGLLGVLIVLLHLRERRQDYQAKLQESNRFHFDAM